MNSISQLNRRDPETTLEQALFRLSDEDRTILWFKYCDDRTDSEIAGYLEVPIATAKFRLRRSQARLNSLLSGKSGPDALRPTPVHHGRSLTCPPRFSDRAADYRDRLMAANGGEAELGTLFKALQTAAVSSAERPDRALPRFREARDGDYLSRFRRAIAAVALLPAFAAPIFAIALFDATNRGDPGPAQVLLRFAGQPTNDSRVAISRAIDAATGSPTTPSSTP